MKAGKFELVEDPRLSAYSTYGEGYPENTEQQLTNPGTQGDIAGIFPCVFAPFSRHLNLINTLDGVQSSPVDQNLKGLNEQQ